MRIDWKIEKKRGNLRPVLRYSVQLEEHEKALALPPVSVLSTIPVPEEESQEYCWPGQFERAALQTAQPRACHMLEIPSHRGHAWTRNLRLPWRGDNDYPEVEASFLLLRRAFEKELTAAGDSLPMETCRSLCCSLEAKAAIAPAIVAERFLKLAAKSASKAG